MLASLLSAIKQADGADADVQAKADALLERGIGSLTDDPAATAAMLHETADAQRLAHWALEYEDIAQVIGRLLIASGPCVGLLVLCMGSACLQEVHLRDVGTSS